MRVRELIDVIAVDVDSGRFDAELKVASADDLLRICPGLIEMHEGTGYFKSYNENSIFIDRDCVRITHFSVQEFLLSTRITNGPARKCAISYARDDPQTGSACLIYLCNQDFWRSSLSPEFFQLYPFARFAASSWYKHRDPGVTETLSIFDAWSWKLLTDPASFELWLQVSNQDRYNGKLVDK